MTAAAPVVVKIGGGLLAAAGLDGLRAACADAAALARRGPVLVVPGGGPFADAVRELDARHGLGDRLAHDLALGAMDQLGDLIGELLPGAAPTPHLRPGIEGLGLLRARPALAGRPEIPTSWTVTSDSLAVLAAGAVGAAEAVLLKTAPGIIPRWPSDDPPLATLTAGRLRALQDRGGAEAVDRYLPEAIQSTGVTVVVRAPAPRDGRPSPGTRITPG